MKITIRKRIECTIILLLSIASLELNGQSPWLIKDINSTNPTNQLSDGTVIGSGSSPIGSSYPDGAPIKMYIVNAIELFFANDGKGGRGLWRTDGTAAGTSLVSTLGIPAGKIMYIEDVVYSTGKLLYFSQWDPVANPALVSIWRSDGTPAGTFPIFSGPNKTRDTQVFPAKLGAQIGDEFYFIAAEKNPDKDSIYTNIYKTDGTVAGTSAYFALDTTHGNFNSEGDISNYLFSINVSPNIVGFNNKIYFNYGPNTGPQSNTGTQIWYGDGVDAPKILPDAPGNSYAIVYEWENVKDQFLIMTAAPSGNGPSQLLRLYPTDIAPVVIGDGTGINFYSNAEPAAITGNKIYYVRNFATAGVTNGEVGGTFDIAVDASIRGFSGVTNAGAIATFYVGTYDYYPKSLIWDGVSPSSYKVLTLISDTLNARYSGIQNVIPFGDTLLVMTGAGTFQSDVNDSYCYLVENAYLAEFATMPVGPKFNNTYIGFGSEGEDEQGVSIASVEPISLRPVSYIWTGAVSSDWNAGGNWLGQKVPGPGDDAVIPPSNRYPVVSTNASCRNLTVNFATLTVNKPANLDVYGYLANYGNGAENNNPSSNITGTGSLTRIGSYSNKTYGAGAYNIDSININGADMDLTSMSEDIPERVYFNSVINFKSDNKLIQNYLDLAFMKPPYVTGYNNKRFIINNRLTPINYPYPSPQIGVNFYNIGLNSTSETAATIPIGSNVNSYTPFTVSVPLNTNGYGSYSLGAHVLVIDSASYNGFKQIFTGVVNKTWIISLNGYNDNFGLGWSASDEGPGFNRNACFVTYFNGKNWVIGKTHAATLVNGTYHIDYDTTFNDAYQFFFPLMVASQPCISATFTTQPANSSVCVGADASFTVQVNNSPGFQWQENRGSGWNNISDNTIYTGTTTNNLTINAAPVSMNGYQYQCILTGTCNNQSSSAAVLTINTQVTPTLTIIANAQGICSGTPVTFTATPVNAGLNPVYQWKVNGINVGQNNSMFTSSILVNGDIVSCVMTGSSSCTANGNVLSNSITMIVQPATAVPAVSISSTGNVICPGSSVTFTATPVNGGVLPLYQWQLNGVNTGSNAPDFTSSTLVNGDMVSCLMTSNAGCITPTPVRSNSITISISANAKSTVSISTSATTICSGVEVSFVASSNNGGNAPSYQWFLNGVYIGSNATVFTSSAFKNGDNIFCIMTPNSSCASNVQDSSNSISLTVNPVVKSSLNISASANGICSDSSVTLFASPSNPGTSPIYQWQINGINVGENNAAYTSDKLKNGDVVNCILTSSIACTLPVTATPGITMSVYPLPVISLSTDLTISDGASLQLNPGISGTISSYLWSPSTGLSDPTIQKPEAAPSVTTTYLLQVSSVNGCTANAALTLHVTPAISTIKVPNVFSPNGDGINDLWNIKALTDLPGCTVDVYDRDGQLLFHSTGYKNPWDGTYNGRPLPVATYYYVIDPKNGGKKMAGAVTILR